MFVFCCLEENNNAYPAYVNIIFSLYVAVFSFYSRDENNTCPVYVNITRVDTNAQQWTRNKTNVDKVNRIILLLQNIYTILHSFICTLCTRGNIYIQRNASDNIISYTVNQPLVSIRSITWSSPVFSKATVTLSMTVYVNNSFVCEYFQKQFSRVSNCFLK